MFLLTSIPTKWPLKQGLLDERATVTTRTPLPLNKSDLFGLPEGYRCRSVTQQHQIKGDGVDTNRYHEKEDIQVSFHVGSITNDNNGMSTTLSWVHFTV